MKKLGILLLFVLLLIGSFPHTAYAAEVPDFDQELTQYLNEISTVRGFEITKEMLEIYMAGVSQDFSDLTSIDEVRDYFGEVIHSDYSNLTNILDTYQLTMTELQQLFTNYGEELSDYVFLDELEFAVYFYITDSAPVVTGIPSSIEVPANTPGDSPVFKEAILTSLFTVLDLSDQEIEKLTDHMSSMEDYFSDPHFLTKLSILQNRLETLSDSNEQAMTKEQASQFADWFRDFSSLLRLQATFFELNNGTEIPLTLEEALLKGDFVTSDLKLVLYSAASEPLADVVLNQKQLEVLFGNLDTAAKELDSVIHEQTAAISGSSSLPRTEKGGKLPQTAVGYLPGAALGFMLLLSGLLLFKKAKNEKKKAQ